MHTQQNTKNVGYAEQMQIVLIFLRKMACVSLVEAIKSTTSMNVECLVIDILISQEGYFSGMTEAEIKDYNEAEKRIEEEKINQYHNDISIIRQLKKQIPKKLFHFIAVALHESENWVELEIVDKPTGKYQQETKDFGMWVDQYCEYEDCYSGYCYVLLPDGKYLKWNYWC